MGLIGTSYVGRVHARGAVRQPGARLVGLAPLGSVRPCSPLPAGHPQRFHDCFDPFVADTYAAMRGEHRDGPATFAHGARAVVITDAVPESARTDRWVAC